MATALDDRRAGRSGHAAVLAPAHPDDVQTRWAIDVAERVASDLSWLGLTAHHVDRASRDKAAILQTAANAAVTLFFGHAQASDSWAALDLGDIVISRDDVAAHSWDGTFVILVGCETSAHDTSAGDLAWEFYSRGARAVVGTSAKISVAIADYFFRSIFSDLLVGVPVDYSFHRARQRTALYETFAARGETEDVAARIEHAFEGSNGQSFATVLDRASLTWDDVLRDATYALTFTLTGGVGERIV